MGEVMRNDDEESVKRRKWERKRRRGKKKLCAVIREDKPDRENERGKRKNDKINVKAAIVSFHI
jgi:hypothetical protein